MQREYIGGDEGLVCVLSFSNAVLYDFPYAAPSPPPGDASEQQLTTNRARRIAGEHIGRIPSPSWSARGLFQYLATRTINVIPRLGGERTNFLH